MVRPPVTGTRTTSLDTIRQGTAFQLRAAMTIRAGFHKIRYAYSAQSNSPPAGRTMHPIRSASGLGARCEPFRRGIRDSLTVLGIGGRSTDLLAFRALGECVKVASNALPPLIADRLDGEHVGSGRLVLDSNKESDQCGKSSS